MARSLHGSVVAVLGAGGGLGRRIAQGLHDRGAQLVLAGPHPERLPTIDGAATVGIDVRDPAAGDLLAATATERFGRLDGLVNAAGVVAFGSLVETDDTTIEELFLTNVMGPLWLLKRVIPLLSASRGFVVQLSAVVAEQPLPNLVAYSASKAALTAADVALARELRRAGVQLCDVRPPHTETDLARHPLAGIAPPLPAGLAPDVVATAVLEAIEAGATELPSHGFSPAVDGGASTAGPP